MSALRPTNEEGAIRREFLPENSSSPEINKANIKTIFELDNAERANLHLDFDNNQGKGRMIVHPYFFHYATKYNRTYPDGQPFYKPSFNLHKEDLVRKMLAKVLLHNKRRVPVFILEEKNFIPETTAMLKEIKGIEHYPIFLPSYEDVGYPLIPGHEERDTLAESNWTDMNQLLASYGAKEFLISGMYLDVEKNKVSEKLIPYYYKRAEAKLEKKGEFPNISYIVQKCVGSAAAGLARKFKVDFSYANFPYSREDIKAIEDRKYKSTNRNKV